MRKMIAIAALAAGTLLGATSFASAGCADNGFQILGNGSVVPCNGSPSVSNGRPWYRQPGVNQGRYRYYDDQQYYRDSPRHRRHRHHDDDYGYQDRGPTFFFGFGR